MRKILIGGVVLLVIFLVVFRQRVFLRDPLGRVERNGVRQGGERVYINYSNDVLLEDVAAHRFVLVQGWSFFAWSAAAAGLCERDGVLDGGE